MNDEEALEMIKQILEEGLKARGCRDIEVEVLSRGELSVSFIAGNELFRFFFG